MKLNLTINDDNGLYSIVLGNEVVYSIPQSEGMERVNSVFDSIARCMSLTIQEISKTSDGMVKGSMEEL